MMAQALVPKTGQHIRIKRVYDQPTDADGQRVLVDRLWPRGLSHESAALDRWFKDIAPSPELRIWFAHDPAKWGEFRRRYWEELAANEASVVELVAMAGGRDLTLLYAARDRLHNHARALCDYVLDHMTS